MVVSIEQACEILGCKERQIFKLLRAGKLERAPRIGKCLRIYKDTVDRLIARPEAEQRKASKRAPGNVPVASRANIKW